MLSPKHSSFVCRLNGITFVVPRRQPLGRRAPKPQRPTAPGKRLRRNAAPQGSVGRPRRGCRVPAVKRRRSGCYGQQGPGASEAGSMARNPVSNLGHLYKVFGIETLRKCLQYLQDCFADGAQIARWSTLKNAAKH